MNDEIQAMFDRLGKHERALVGEHLDRIEQKLAKRDAMADWLFTVLESRLRKLINEEIANAKTGNL